MKTESINKLIIEIREEYQIPLFFDSKALENFIFEGSDELSKLVEEFDVDNDLTARSLLKNYVNYAFNKRTNEFFELYLTRILSWRLSKNVT